jgi:hypothetical protein
MITYFLATFVAVFAVALGGPALHSQQVGSSSNSSLCAQAERRQFDFWIGEWDLRWEKDGRGTNIIRTTLDGCVITEEFDGTPSIPLRGSSVSTFSRQLGKWQQSWVDNQAGYLDFVGEFKDGRMVLERKAMLEGKEIVQRMVWYNIAKEKLDWNWERSEDGGKTWKVLWKIHYSRKKG